MRILNLALNDLLQIIRDWKSFLFLLIMPVIFTLVFGFAFGGFDTGDEEVDPRLPVGFVDQDQEQISPVLFALLKKSDAIRPVTFEEDTTLEELERIVAEDELAAMIIVPDGYSESLPTDQKLKLIIIQKEATSAGATVQNGVQAAVNRLTNSISAAQFSTMIQAQFNPFGSQTDQDAYFDGSLENAVASWDAPPFTLISTQTGAEEERAEQPNAFSHSSPGMMVQFAIAGLIGAAGILVIERKSGSLQRLLTTAISRTEILIGHFLAMFLMVLIQFTILIGFAAIFLDVGYFDAPLATILVTLTTALFVASMGMLIGTLAKSEEQVIMYSLIPMFILSGLGGAWVPLEFTSPTFRTVGHFTPVAWAMDGFQNIVMRGMGLESVLMPAAILLGFTAACFGLAVWRFEYE
ncbi:MAG: ABC transporter permease [Anaerolineales bacterium]|nr:ABC transporter permease [Chloroflexota bacterium]MBL6980639.1 ABC transporter permease [Anaerolineales bacterium]